MNKAKEDESDRHSLSIKLYLLPIAAAAGIIPLIVRVYPYTNDELIRYDWFADALYSYADVFLAYKSFALQGLLAAVLISKGSEDVCGNRYIAVQKQLFMRGGTGYVFGVPYVSNSSFGQ